MDFVTAATSVEEGRRSASVAVLPVGSFEQHGSHLPLATDTIIAGLIASRVADAYDLFLLPPVTISCSHEHAGFPGTVSITSATLHRLITDIADDLARAGIHRLALVNGHGGNYVLSNIAQEASATTGEAARRMIVFPGRTDWGTARSAAQLTSDASADMHGGEGETSLLLHGAPHLVRDGWQNADHEAPERPDLLLLGIRGYTPTGIIGTPSAATADKGRVMLDALTAAFAPHLTVLSDDVLACPAAQ
ncbi:MAG: creatininase family protein [Dermatophilaceae bacterium]